jgi:hypothetical protein
MIRIEKKAHIALLALTLFIFMAVFHAYAGLAEGLKALEEGNYGKAFTEINPLAFEGNAEAQFNFGLMYAKGLWVSQNDGEAVKWYRKAAEQGNPQARLELGLMYYNGLGVAQNSVEGFKWAILAAGQGNKQAKKIMNLMIKKMTPEQITEAEKEAKEWNEKHNH